MGDSPQAIIRAWQNSSTKQLFLGIPKNLNAKPGDYFKITKVKLLVLCTVLGMFLLIGSLDKPQCYGLTSWGSTGWSASTTGGRWAAQFKNENPISTGSRWTEQFEHPEGFV
jgi:hypothetical protein